MMVLRRGGKNIGIQDTSFCDQKISLKIVPYHRGDLPNFPWSTSSLEDFDNGLDAVRCLKGT